MNSLLSWATGALPPIDQEALRKKLGYIDESSLADLLQFKRDLENQLRAPSNYLQSGNPRRVIQARSLSRDEVFILFDLKDIINDQGQHAMPEWDPPGAPGICSEWLARALNIGVDVFRPKYSDITAIINLVILDVIHDLPQFQVLDHFKAGETAPERPPSSGVTTPGGVCPPKRLKIRSYKQNPIAALVGSGGGLTEIVGTFNAVFTCGYLMSTMERNVTIISTHLIVLKVKSGHMMFANKLVHDSTNQLCAYLAMIQRGQEGWYKRMGEERGRFGVGTGYGVVSDGEFCRFIEVNADKTVRFGDVLLIKYDIHKVLQYLRYIFMAIVADYRPRN